MSFEFSREFEIAGRVVGKGCPAYIIAEAGVAHFGSMEKAYRLVDLACDAKADAVKFQIFQTRELISAEAGEWIERLASKELPYEAFIDIASYCKNRGITFFATAHDEPSFEFLDQLDVPVYKIGSGEVDNWPFIETIAKKGKPVILSTGMYTHEQIRKVCKIFKAADNPDLAILHCVTSYPTEPDLVNLKAMESISRLGVITGYSDHTRGFHFPLAAAALGAAVIEKHITLDFDVPNAQDWKVSCGPDDLHLMVDQIREIQAGLGSGEKAPNKAEEQSLAWARKSLVAARDVKSGETVTEDMLVFKRPGTGISPSELNKALGKKAAKDIHKDEVIAWEHLN